MLSEGRNGCFAVDERLAPRHYMRCMEVAKARETWLCRIALLTDCVSSSPVDLGIEWLDQIELLLIIEDEFAGIQFSNPPAIELVGDLLRYIEMTSTQSNLISAAA